MAKFLKGNELNSEIEKILESAYESIILISPYIKLHEKYKYALRTKIKDDDIKLTILFGKNKEDMSKSMKQEDFDFFTEFPNIEILYQENLHAKYYANESKAVLTSMNLYDFSQNNNIEAGILMENTFKGMFTGSNSLESDSWEYFYNVLEQAERLFVKEPVYEKKNLISSEKYVRSEILLDKLSDFFNNKSYKKEYKKTAKKKAEQSANTNNPINVTKPSGTLLSITKLTTELNCTKVDLENLLKEVGYVKGNEITPKGIQAGLVLKSFRGNDYIAYPNNLEVFNKLN